MTLSHHQQRPSHIKRLAGLHIVYVVNVDWFFVSHRLPLARAALLEGATVTVVAEDTGSAQRIRAAGMSFVRAPFSRRSRNPLRDFWVLLRLAWLYRKLKPDLLHHVTIKPVIYGTLAARVAAPRTVVVNAVTGLGFTFSQERSAHGLQRLVRFLYRLALRNRRQLTIFQNPDDAARFVGLGLVQEANTVIIRGSGVDCEEFVPSPLPLSPPVVLLASRMLWDKGVGVLVEAARKIHTTRPHVRFVLAGRIDSGNPAAIPEGVVRGWVEERHVEWWGERGDMPHVLRQTTIVVLPTTYPEGVPKVLLEAAASGRPMIASNRPGCREIVQPGKTGILIDPQQADELADAITSLLDDNERMKSYATAARALVNEEFSVDLVVHETLERYYDALRGIA